MLPPRVQRCAGCYGARRQPTSAQFFEMDAAFYQGHIKSQNNSNNDIEMQPRLIGHVKETNKQSTSNWNTTRRTQLPNDDSRARRPPSRTPARKPLYEDPGYCWYHQNFGARANKCRMPCSIWTNPPKELKGKLDKNKIQIIKADEPDNS